MTLQSQLRIAQVGNFFFLKDDCYLKLIRSADFSRNCQELTQRVASRSLPLLRWWQSDGVFGIIGRSSPVLGGCRGFLGFVVVTWGLNSCSSLQVRIHLVVFFFIMERLRTLKRLNISILPWDFLSPAWDALCLLFP